MAKKKIKTVKSVKTRRQAKTMFNKIRRGARGADNPAAVAASVMRKQGKGRFLGRRKRGRK